MERFEIMKTLTIFTIPQVLLILWNQEDKVGAKYVKIGVLVN